MLILKRKSILSGMDMDNLYLKLITSYYRGLHLMMNADFWSPWITADSEVCVILGIVNCIKTKLLWHIYLDNAWFTRNCLEFTVKSWSPFAGD